MTLDPIIWKRAPMVEEEEYIFTQIGDPLPIRVEIVTFLAENHRSLTQSELETLWHLSPGDSFESSCPAVVMHEVVRGGEPVGQMRRRVPIWRITRTA